MSDQRATQRPDGSRASVIESAQLAAYLAELSRAGMPLGTGLRAVAAELPRRDARLLRSLSDRLERGEPLERIVEDPALGLPPHFRGIIAAGISSSRLAEILEEFIAHQRMTREIRRSVMASLAYPALLIVVLLIWIMLLSSYLLPPLIKMYRDFDIVLPPRPVGGFIMRVPDFAEWLRHFGTPLVGTVLGLALLAFLVLSLGYGWSVASEALSMLPLVGPVWRSCGLAQCSDMLALLTDADVPAAAALRLTGDSLRDAALSRACVTTANRVQAGSSLAQGMQGVPTFPPTLRAVVSWGERSNALGGALRTAAEMFRTRAELYRDLMQTVLPPILFLLIACTATMLLSVFLWPMLVLLQSLT